MAERSMEVDTALLHYGADRCGDAAGTALAAAAKLAEKQPQAGMFGDFETAHAFHRAVAAVHQGHVEQFQSHHGILRDIGDKTHSGADEFAAKDTSAADSLKTAGADLEAF